MKHLMMKKAVSDKEITLGLCAHLECLIFIKVKVTVVYQPEDTLLSYIKCVSKRVKAVIVK